jgi:hypothetical protein
MEKKKTPPNPIQSAIKRISWPSTPELDELIWQFARDFSRLYHECYNELMEAVDVEEFSKMIEQKLRQANGIDTD